MKIQEFVSIFIYSRRFLTRRKEAGNSLASEELEDLLVGELFATDRAELLWKTGQALVAGSMAALKGTFLSLFLVVAFQTDVASGPLIMLWAAYENINSINIFLST